MSISQTHAAPMLEVLLTADNTGTDSVVTDRCGGGRYVYEQGELSRIEMPDGYIESPLSDNPVYRYYYRLSPYAYCANSPPCPTPIQQVWIYIILGRRDMLWIFQPPVAH